MMKEVRTTDRTGEKKSQGTCRKSYDSSGDIGRKKKDRTGRKKSQGKCRKSYDII